MVNLVKKKIYTISGISISILVISVMMIFILLGAILGDNSNDCDTSSDSDFDVNVTGVAGGDWTVKGTESYNTAKTIFDFMTKKVGMSGAGAAGVVGNALVESGFNPKASNGTHFGLFQWTQNRLEAGGYIKSEEDKTVENELKVLKYELDHGYKTAKVQVGKASDPSTAAKLWDDDFEKSGGQALAKRQAGAVRAYELFGGASINVDDSILGSTVDGANAGEQALADEENTSCNDGSVVVSGSWIWPFSSVPKSGPKLVAAQKFGNDGGFRTNSFHDGVDFGDATYNGDIHAVHGGKISKIVKPGEYGVGFYLVWETTDDGYGISYQEFGDMNDISVKEGDTVKTGDKIGVSRPGGEEYSHLHLGISKEKDLGKALGKSFTDDGTWLNPVEVIKKGLDNDK